MGLEALPARWHLLFTSSRPSSRPFPSADAGLHGSSTVFRRRLSDAAEGPSSSRKHQVFPVASLDGGVPSSGFSSRGPRRSEKCCEGGPSSSSLRFSESSWSGNGFPERTGPSGLFRWNSESAGLMRMATTFEDFPGDGWRKQDDDSCHAEAPFQGFKRLDVGVLDIPSGHGAQDSGRAAWLRFEAARYESQGMRGDRELGTAAAEVPTVELTAPNFVRDIQFMERREHSPQAGMVDRMDLSCADRQTDDVSVDSRPASLKRETTKVYSSLDNTTLVEGFRRVEQTPLDLRARAEWLSTPDSLRNLKKRNRRGAGREGVCAIKKSFDSMVFMIRTLQSYTLQMHQILLSDVDVEKLLSLVHREMHSSFVWLFQQVFSCTPTLMVSVMILLANFTVFSLGNNVAIWAMVSPDAPPDFVSILQSRGCGEGPLEECDGRNTSEFVHVDRSVDSSPPSTTGDILAGHGFGNYRPGGLGGRSVIVADGEDGDYNARGASDRNAMFSEKDSNSLDPQQHLSAGRGNFPVPLLPPNVQQVSIAKSSETGCTGAEQPANLEELKSSRKLLSYQSLLEQTARELELKPGEPYHHVQSNQETLRILVAPVATKMDSDNYLCFDRTDLEYQHAISAEPANPMLLANYAQFLYAVRRDNIRAERFFLRALKADSEDGGILGRWASFLWLALKDPHRAEIAYRAAIALDPSNPFYAGGYAHFLWHAGDDEGPSCHPQPSFSRD